MPRKEDDLYLCTWKESSKGKFRLWVKGEPKLRVEGTGDFDELAEELSEKIRDSGGALHAVLEFTPPAPVSESRFTEVPLIQITANEVLQIDNIARYFDVGPCTACRHLTGNRNRKPLELDKINPRFDAVFADHTPLVSEDFLSLLTDTELASFRIRPVITKKPSKKEYFEIVGKPKLPLVAVMGLETDHWQCKKCGHQQFFFYSQIKEFVPLNSVKRLKSPVFTTGHSGWIRPLHAREPMARNRRQARN